MFYLLCNPKTKMVERKSHSPAKAKEGHLVSLQVSKETWKDFRSGDVMTAASLPEATYKKWLSAIV